MLPKILPALYALLIAMPCRADLPMSIEDLLTERDAFRLDFGLSYANTDTNNASARFEWVQTGTGSFILLPVAVSDRRQNSDVLAATLGARYGVTANTEIYSRVTGIVETVRIASGGAAAGRTAGRFGQWAVGVNHQFSEDGDTPALLAFAELLAAENTAVTGVDFIHGKTAQIGLTTYRSIDPVVLSLTAGYRYAGRRDIDGQRINPGDLLFINPGLGFAVNSDVTLTGGVQFKFQGKDTVAGSGAGIRTSQTGLELGLGYAVAENLTLNFKIRANVSGIGGAQSNIDFIYNIN